MTNVHRHMFLSLILCFCVVACNPFKVTDPSDPRFDPMKFRFEDYDRTGLHRALSKLLPVGTPESKVDSLLLNGANATKVDSSVYHANTYTYSKHITGAWFRELITLHPYAGYAVIVEYDHNNNLTKFTLKTFKD